MIRRVGFVTHSLNSSDILRGESMEQHRLVFRFMQTPLGEMVAGASSRGLCLMEFRDRGGLERISARIRKRYGTEMVAGESPFLDQASLEIGEYFAGVRQSFTVALDMKGTTFEQRVWDQLLHIPYGETRSYGYVASLLGKPGAGRAVGRANGANYIAVIVPCHRVIEEGGHLRGYGGGLWRKRQLLDLEGQGNNSAQRAFQFSSDAP